MALKSPPTTPAMVIDLPVVERNIKRLIDYCQSHDLKLRPHIKTHKSLFMARLQLKLGASGLTAAKLGEAQVMAQAWPDGDRGDLLIAYPALDTARTAGIAELAKEKNVRLAIDSIQAADALGSASSRTGTVIGVLVDIDCGFGRTGLQNPAQSLELAQHVEKTGGLRLDGLFTFPGQIADVPAVQADALGQVQELLQASLDLWRSKGLEAEIVSGGSTPTTFQSHLVPALTEIRPGTSIYFDTNCLRGEWCTIDDCAARLTCTIVSNAVPGKCVMDAGTKTLSSDLNFGGRALGYGHVVEYPQATIVRLTEEHGELDLSKCDKHPRLGERITVIANHICPCMNLQESVWLRDASGSLEPLTIDAQRKLH